MSSALHTASGIYIHILSYDAASTSFCCVLRDLLTYASVNVTNLPVSQVQQVHFWTTCYAQQAHVPLYRVTTESHGVISVLQKISKDN
jgi:hypothetical protein